MTRLETKGDSNIAKGKLIQKWASLSEDDLMFDKDRQEELRGRPQKCTGETRDGIEKAIKEVCSSYGCGGCCCCE